MKPGIASASSRPTGSRPIDQIAIREVYLCARDRFYTGKLIVPDSHKNKQTLWYINNSPSGPAKTSISLRDMHCYSYIAPQSPIAKEPSIIHQFIGLIKSGAEPSNPVEIHEERSIYLEHVLLFFENEENKQQNLEYERKQSNPHILNSSSEIIERGVSMNIQGTCYLKTVASDPNKRSPTANVKDKIDEIMEKQFLPLTNVTLKLHTSGSKVKYEFELPMLGINPKKLMLDYNLRQTKNNPLEKRVQYASMPR
ncbi:hypothetical protein JXB31_01920 [Candidatus Woesearchaeota archaeon]|nr:hypothetical protein [Candidatus Woesearchaeota archaeon]